MTPEPIQTTCCIVGGGPAGMMLGYLLVRQGVRVTVLEKHKDFFRDFRGDTVHPSTLQLFYELDLLDDLLKVPHQRLEQVSGAYGGYPIVAASFRHVPAHCKFVALMPQWDFLNFLSSQAQRFPLFDLRMEHEATGLLSDGNSRVTGVQVKTPRGEERIEADLVVGCDGRHSITRRAGRLNVHEFGVPIDVLWFRISRHSGDPDEVFGNINYGRALILINRSDYFQAGLIVKKGSFEELKAAGLENFQETVRKIAPYLGDRVLELQDWDQVKLLTVQINRLQKWNRPGLLCIGDAAHAMSPAGGVGINLAIQDAVATANLLGAALRDGRLTDADMAAVQRRREFPTKVTQALQINAHKAFSKIFENPGPMQAPWQLKVVTHIPVVRHILGRVVGMGVRPEHVADAPTRAASGKRWLKSLALGAGIAVGLLAARRRRYRLT